MDRRLWVVSPRLRGGGTENALHAELCRLPDNMQLLFVSEAGQTPALPGQLYPVKARGPGPLRFLSFYRQASRIIKDRRKPGDIVYSAGINCNCSDIITAHISFADYASALRQAQQFGPAPRLKQRINRFIWLGILQRLESQLYLNGDTLLAAVSPRTACQLADRWQRPVSVTVAPPRPFVEPTPEEVRDMQSCLAAGARQIVLGVGNDWHNKGFWFVSRVLADMDPAQRPLFVVAGSENPEYGKRFLRNLGVEHDIRWLGQVKNMNALYSCVDLLLAPSFEDSFALPVREAMQAGLPVLVSDRVGAAHWYGLPMFPAGDRNAWRSAIRKALVDPVRTPFCEPSHRGVSLAELLEQRL